MSKETFSDHPWSDHLLTEKLRRLYVIIERSDGIHLFGGAGRQTDRQGGLVQRRGENPSRDRLGVFSSNICALATRAVCTHPGVVSGRVEV